METKDQFFLFLLGFLGSTLGKMLGIGGGILFTPAFEYWFALGIKEVAPLSLALVCTTSIIAIAKSKNYPNQGVQKLLVLCFGAASAGVIGRMFLLQLTERTIDLMFAVLIFGIAIFYIWGSMKEDNIDAEAVPRYPFWLLFITVAAFSLVGPSLGVGGGVFYTPILYTFCGFSFGKSVSWSLWLVLASSGAALIYNGGVGVVTHLSISGLVIASLGGFFGVILAGYLTRKIPRGIKLGFGVILVLLAFSRLIDNIV